MILWAYESCSLLTLECLYFWGKERGREWYMVDFLEEIVPPSCP